MVDITWESPLINPHECVTVVFNLTNKVAKSTTERTREFAQGSINKPHQKECYHGANYPKRTLYA